MSRGEKLRSGGASSVSGFVACLRPYIGNRLPMAAYHLSPIHS